MIPVEHYQEAARSISERIGKKPVIGMVLGSGLGVMAEEITEGITIPYSEILHFPESTVEGHAGEMVIGELEGKTVLALKGRFHYYEGYDMERVVFPIRVMKILGIENLLVTNAAGGVNTSFKAGELMVINDHIKMFTESPLRGPNNEKFGSRFNDMTEAYSKELRCIAKSAAKDLGLTLQEGVYAFMGGPSYETPAEIRMLRLLGADAVGMSTVPEVIAASHGGMKVLGLSCITNMAAGILDQPLDHGDVMETSARVRGNFISLVREILKRWEIGL
ncbi:MAG: purine-nucleoside phosphorylase [Spirochaetales bacterium]|nr:purine-nucleoside phosphorylase [Spirochaetales bacterium]